MNTIDALEATALEAITTMTTAGAQGGPALVRLAADLDKLISQARFPELVVTWTDDEDGEPSFTWTCPTCNGEVDEDSLYAVDRAERWTKPSSIEADHDAAPGETPGYVSVDFDDHGEFGDTLYWLHDSGKPHPVELPYGWEVI